MIIVSYNNISSDTWEEVTTEIVTDLEPNPMMLRILEMSSEGLITRGQAWRKIVDEVSLAYGVQAAVKLVEDNPNL